MTQNAIDDDNANPYNARKDYQVPDGVAPASADSIFQPEAAPAPVEPKANAEATSTENKPEDNHDYKKRWSDLKKRYDEKITDYKVALAEAESSEGKEPNVQIPKTEAELEVFKETEPKLYELFTGIAKLQVKEDTEQVKQQLNELNDRELKLAKSKALEEIRSNHNDFDTITNSEDFHNWAENQPKEIQEWIYNNPTNSSLAIRAIEMYKSDVAKVEKDESADLTQSQEVVDASSMVSTRPTQEPNATSKKIWSEKEIKGLSMDQYDAHESEIDQAILEGRVRP